MPNVDTTSYFTFGHGHRHVINDVVYDHNVIVRVTAPDPRAVMFKYFGSKWAFEYDESAPPKLHHFPRGIITLDPNMNTETIPTLATKLSPFDNVAGVQKNHAILEAFLDLHPEFTDTDLTTHVSCEYWSKPTLMLRDAARVGAVIGVHGWIRELNRQHYDWIKDVDGVKLRIVEAEPVMMRPAVMPAEFPLLLTSPSEPEPGDIF